MSRGPYPSYRHPSPYYRTPGRSVAILGSGTQLIVSDSFNRADNASSLGTADTGQAWTAHDGTWGIISNQAYQNGTSTANLGAATVESGKSNGDVQVTFVAHASSDTCRLTFRLSDGNNFLFVNAGGGVWKLVAGSLTSLGTVGAYANGDVCKVNLAGSTITVFRNGSQVGQFSDSFNSSATRHGLGQGSADGSVRWDSFTVVG